MDLSFTHRPISPLFRERSESTSCLIDADLAAGFNQNGFIFNIPLLDDVQISALRTDLDRMMVPAEIDQELFYEYNLNESRDDRRRLFHALGAWRVFESFHDLVFSDKLVKCAETLLGAPVRLWHDQVFVKPAHDGSVVAWHQDYSYWTRTVPLAHLTCWIALDDADEANGCVHYVPGSHRWHLLPRTDLGNDMSAVLKNLNSAQIEEFLPIPAVMKAGHSSFHHPMTLHGSYENRSDRPRRGVVVNFIRDGVRSNTYEPLLEGVPIIPMGDKIEGRFFPLLSKDLDCHAT